MSEVAFRINFNHAADQERSLERASFRSETSLREPICAAVGSKTNGGDENAAELLWVFIMIKCCSFQDVRERCRIIQSHFVVSFPHLA